MNTSGTRRAALSWATKAGLAILDQGLFTGSNFVVSILLARWLSSEAYGTYAVAFTVFLLVLAVYQALMLEPMLVLGSAGYRNSHRTYIRALLLLHCVMGLSMLILLGVSAVVALERGKATSLPGALAGIAIATPLLLLFWLVKRVFYLMLSPAASVWGAVLYSLLAIGGLAIVSREHLLSAFSAFVLLGVSALVSSGVLFVVVRYRLPASAFSLTVSETWYRHWQYGRWALGANVMMWIPVSIYYPLMSAFAGMTEAAQLKALMNLLSPVLQTCAAFASLILPYATRKLNDKGVSAATSVSWQMTLLCTTCAIPYWAILLFFQRPVFNMLYSGRYVEVSSLLPIVALTSICGSAFFGPSLGLRAMESPRSVFVAVVVSSCASVAVGIPASWAYGLRGALWSMALSEALAFAAAAVLLQKKTREYTGSLNLAAPAAVE